MSTALETAFAEMETRLGAIRKVNGFNTDIGLGLHPAGTYLTEEDAPCLALYESRPDDSGVMRIDASSKPNACGMDFEVAYMVQGFVTRVGTESPLHVAEEAAEDILRALMGANRGALTSASMHSITGRGRGLTVKGGNVVPVLVFGRFVVNEKVYQ